MRLDIHVLPAILRPMNGRTIFLVLSAFCSRSCRPMIIFRGQTSSAALVTRIRSPSDLPAGRHVFVSPPSAKRIVPNRSSWTLCSRIFPRFSSSASSGICEELHTARKQESRTSRSGWISRHPRGSTRTLPERAAGHENIRERVSDRRRNPI